MDSGTGLRAELLIFPFIENCCWQILFKTKTIHRISWFFTQPPNCKVRLGCKLFLPMIRLNLEIGALAEPIEPMLTTSLGFRTSS